MTHFTVLAACILPTLFLPAHGMIHGTNPLHAVCTLMFKQIQQESVSSKDLHDAHAQFKTYRAIRNWPPMSRKKTSLTNPVFIGNNDEK